MRDICAKILSTTENHFKDDDEDGRSVRFQRVGGWGEPMAETSQTYHFRVEALKIR